MDTAQNIKDHKTHGREFCQIFGRPLSHFWDNLLRFDVVAFDDWLETPDGTSTADFVTEKYGQRAKELVKSLL